MDNTTPVSCNGVSDGTATVTVENETGTVNYMWSASSGPASGANPTNLPAGNHTVTVSDDSGAACEVVLNVNITEPAAIVLGCTQVSGETTPGANDGVGNVNISGGTGPYTIAYTDGGANNGTIDPANAGDNNITDLPPATYTVTVTDDNGCSETCTFTITPGGCTLNAAATVDSNVSCNGENDGAATITTENAQGTVTYMWPPSSGPAMGANPTDLPAGNYVVTVTDDSGAACAVTVNVNITEPNAIVLTCAEDAPESNPDAEDGAGSVEIAGGTAPFTIDYTGPETGSMNAAAAGTFLITDLMPGSYDVTVTDDNGCTETCTFVITEADCALSAVLTDSSDVLCNGDATGTAEITVMNTSGTVTYDWGFPGISGPNPTNLSAATYNVTVSDDTGAACEQIVTVVINEPASPLTLNCTQQSGESTPGAADGVANINLSGGSAPYTIDYTDSDGTTQTVNGAVAGDNLISDLTPDTYTVVVTDDNGCTETCTVTITSANCMLNAEVTETEDVSCAGDADGSALITVTNEGANLTFTWSASTNGATGANPTDLPAGNHSVTVSDDTGADCQIVLSVNIGEPADLVLNCSVTDDESSPGAADGAINVSIAGGTAPFTVSYTGAATGTIDPAAAGDNPIADLPAGSYDITVTDDNGCTETCTVNVTAGNCSLTANITQTGENNCADDCTASILVNPQGFTGTVNYDWSDDTFDGQDNPTGVCAGNYSVTVTDDTGAACAVILSITIDEPAPVTVDCAQDTPVSSTGAADGVGSVTVGGGTAPYDIAYTSANGTSGTADDVAAGEELITDLPAGTYDVTVTDAGGCTATCSFIIQDGNCVLTANLDDTTDILCNGDATGAADISVANESGMVIYDWSDDAFDGMSNPTNLPAGIYTVTITDDTGCSVIINVNITEPDDLVLACAQDTGASPQGASNGVGSVTITGGTAPFTIDYTGPMTGSQAGDAGENLITDLPGGSYNVTVTDDNGCTETCTFVIQDGDCDLVAALLTVDENCPGACDGSATVDVSAGTGPYTYNWSAGTVDEENSTDLCAGTISVTVTAANGCELVLTGTIGTQNNVPTADAGADDATCGTTYTLNATASVGVGTWTFSTATGGTAVIADPNAANTEVTIDVPGDYTFTWTENNGGCTDSDETVITFQTEPFADVTPNANTCNASADGSVLDFTALVTGGDTGGTWADTDGTGVDLSDLTAVDFDAVAPGTYTFTYTTNSASADCVDQSYTTEILVEDCACPSVATAPTDDLCNDNAVVDLSDLQITTEAGTWTIETAPIGATATVTGTVFNATGSAAGAYTVRFTLNSPVAGCPEFSEQVINVSGTVSAGTADTPQTFCAEDTNVVDLFDALTDADAGGIWTETSAMPSTGGAFDPVAGTFDVTGQAAGNYTFEYTVNGIAPCGSDSETVMISIFDEINAEAGTGGEISCSNTTVTLNGSSTTPGVTYQWTTVGGSFVDPLATDQPTVEVNGAGTFILTVTSPNGCTGTDEVEVTQSPEVPVADAGGDQSLTCDNGGSVTLDGSNSSSGANVTLEWTDENGSFIADLPMITVTEAGIYTLTVTITTATGTCEAVSSVTVTDETANPTVIIDNGGLIDCQTVTVELDGSDSDNGPEFTYQWMLNGSPIAGATDLMYTATEAGIYMLEITNTATGCVGTEETEVLDASAFPGTDAGPDMTLNCEVLEVTLDGTDSQQSPNFVFEWENTDGEIIGSGQTLDVTEPGTYILMITDPTNNCENSDAVIVIGDYEEAEVDIADNSMISCDDETAVLFASAEAGIYQWLDADGEAIPGETGLTLETTEIGTYTLQVIADDNGCTGTAEGEVLNNTEAATGVELITTPTTCFGDGDGTALIDTVIGGGLNYVFSIDNQPFVSVPFFNNLESGEHPLIVQSDNGCEFATVITIVEGNDLAVAVTDEMTGIIGDDFDLTATVTPELAVLDTIYWEGDSLSCVNCFEVTVNPLETETYTFTVTDENGCTVTESLTVFVGLGDGIYVPNSFSPSTDDGFNDIFRIYADTNVERINSFRIFNRWGEMVHEATDFLPNDETGGWNGMHNGEMVNTQVFAYYIELTYVNGETRIITGDVTKF